MAPANEHEQTAEGIFQQVRRVAQPPQRGENSRALDLPSSEETMTLSSVQRAPEDHKSKPAPQGEKKKLEPRDVVIILHTDSNKAVAVTEAALIAPGAQILYATSLQDLVKQLKTVKIPVRTLFLMGHSNADGDIVFETLGQLDFVPAERIAQSLKGVIQVENIDFGGCAVGVSPREMDKVRVALNATRARGSTCELVKQVVGPIKTPEGKAITDRKMFDLTNKKNKDLFDRGFKMLHDALKDDRKKCIINDSEDGYFQAHGQLLAIWANPESIAGDASFDKSKSVCYGDLKTEVVDPSKNPVIDENQCEIVETRR